MFYLIFLFFALFLYLNLLIVTEQHYILLAASFLKGSLSFVDVPKNLSDLALYEGEYYWSHGPFPAILLMPGVFFFKNFLQGYIQFPLALINFFLVYKIAKILKLDAEKALLMSVFFIFGSIYTPVGSLPGSNHFAHVVAVSCLIGALYEFFTKKRFLLIGILIALASATRLTLILSAPFFFIFLFERPLKMSNIYKFILPIILVLALLSAYNYKRFGNILETGFNHQLIFHEAEMRRDIGLFSIKHIPTNLFYMLFSGPLPVSKDESHTVVPPYLRFDPYGMSIFFLSPVLFLIFKTKFKEKLINASILTIIVMLIPIITYNGIGAIQVGYRFALDFFPFVLLILIPVFKDTNIKILYTLIFVGIVLVWLFTFQMLIGFY